jgi:hypothetical protein
MAAHTPGGFRGMQAGGLHYSSAIRTGTGSDLTDHAQTVTAVYMTAIRHFDLRSAAARGAVI